MTAVADPFAQALRDALVAEHEAHIAEIERRAADAAARGDEWNHHRNLEHAAQLRAMPYPWQTDPQAA
jgi:hypothetical protein